MLDQSGHRQRVKERFRQEGLEHFHEMHVLELLLFYCIPRKNTKDIARALINRFGSLPQVLEASVEELERVEGVGPNVSTFLKLITETNRFYLNSRATKTVALRKTKNYGEYLVNNFLGQRNEMVYLLCLDARCRVLCCKKINEGTVNSAQFSVRTVAEIALAVNASQVVLSHNHTSGLALPSQEDIQTTLQLAQALSAVDIILADHVIVADQDYYSLAQHGHYNPRDYGG